MDIQKITEARYSTKKFDPAKKISAADFDQLKAALRNAPSSVNIQPWYFVIADDEAGKARVVKAIAPNFPFNAEKVSDASHVVVFAARKHADDAFLDELLEKEDQDGRYANAEFKAGGDLLRHPPQPVQRRSRVARQTSAHQYGLCSVRRRRVGHRRGADGRRGYGGAEPRVRPDRKRLHRRGSGVVRLPCGR